MAKRFTDTEKYKKPFIRSLKGPYKLLWDYLYHDCNHAGIWIVDFEIAQVYIGTDMPINEQEALKAFNSDELRVIKINNGKQWFIPSFIDFQYGQLNPQNRAHNSVIQILLKHNLYESNKGLTRGLEGPKDKYKDKDMDKDKELIPTEKEFLEYARTLQPYKTEYEFSIKAKYEAWKNAKWKDGNGKKIKNWKTKLKNTFQYLKPIYTDTKGEKRHEPTINAI